MKVPTASVVIAAHDEQATIARTLTELTRDAAPGEFEIVVVCNGCRDATADVARSHEGVLVVEIPEAGKSGALRVGEEHVAAFPRIFLDADVLLTTAAARALVDVLGQEAPAVAGLLADVDLGASTRGVRWFYDFRQRLPVFQAGVIGSGVYALNAAGRRRFGPWPDVLGDDLLALRLFDREERHLVTGHRTVIGAPHDLGAVVRRGIRVRRGNRQLDEHIESLLLSPRPSSGFGVALVEALRHPQGWPGIVTFVAVTVLVRVGAWGAMEGDWRIPAGEEGAREPSDHEHRAA
jgi:glycosyltransferase involved in cell wall biosynthesis